MPKIPKNWTTMGKKAVGAGKQALVIGQLMTTLAGAGSPPPIVKGDADLVKQYGQYAKEVRLPETRRDNKRRADSAIRARNAELSGTQLITGKNLKELKNKK